MSMGLCTQFFRPYRRRAYQPCSLGVMLVAAAAGCGNAASEELGVARSEIIGGVPAPAPDLDHTGALVAASFDSELNLLICTATLIGPQTAVTAKHCIEGVEELSAFGFEPAWVRGARFGEPDELVPVVAIEVAPVGSEPGALGIGRDVAVLHLDDTTDVEPARLGSFGEGAIGSSMVTLGYGATGATPTLSDGLRRIGSETLVATEGRLFEAIYGDFETYVEVEVTGEATSEDALEMLSNNPALADVAALAEKFERTLLIEGHEAVTKTFEGDTRNCHGDSGGPLAKRDEQGHWTTYGVFSGVPHSNQSQCDFAQVYATFGPITLKFLEEAKEWSDPCDDVDEAGTCRGDLLGRCDTDLGNRKRELVEVDCIELGATCERTAAGAACSAPL